VRLRTQAHAAAAIELLGDEQLVWTALRDLDRSALEEKEKQLLRFVGKVTKDLPALTADDVGDLRAAGWDDEAIYYAITTCALFNVYNRWITSTGVRQMSDDGHRQQGKMLASRGYTRD
jgi:alkylhydroperoxidase family enzyme